MPTYKFNGPTNPSDNNITGIISHYLPDGTPNVVSPGEQIELSAEKAAELAGIGCDLEEVKSASSSSSASSGEKKQS